MRIYSIYDKDFADFGKVIEKDWSELIQKLDEKPCPVEGTMYEPSDKELENISIFDDIALNLYGGMPIQIGYCNGHNDTLNCLEYHKGNELNIAATDVILLVGRQQDIKEGKYDTAKVKGFLLPAGKCVELYGTTLHYAPCGVNRNGFRVAVILPKGTNYKKPEGAACCILRASNKWLLAHPDSPEAKDGAYIGLVGENIKV